MVNRQLTVFAVQRLQRREIRPLLALLHAVQFEWMVEPGDDLAGSYAEQLTTLMEACGWSMKLQPEDMLVSEPRDSQGVSEEEME